MGKCKDCVAGLLGPCEGDLCRHEREALVEQARCRAEENGHALGEFSKVRDYAVWEARCERCACVATVRLDPSVGQESVCGDALCLACPSPDRARAEGNDPPASGEQG